MKKIKKLENKYPEKIMAIPDLGDLNEAIVMLDGRLDQLKDKINEIIEYINKPIKDHSFEQGHAKELCQICGQFEEDHKPNK